MRGALFIVIVFSLLTVCFLVVKNIESDPEEGMGQVETIQQAEEAAKQTEEALKKRIKKMNR